jgi:amidase
MKRRNFLRNSAGAGITALASSLISAIPNEVDAFALNEVTIDALQEKMRAGQLTSQKLTKMYLDRIATVDKKINAVIELNPDALSIAAQLDSERKAGRVRGPLHGIPVLIKDNIDTGDKMMTTAGASALIGNKASKDAYIVSKLREAGAVLLGKTNLSEWANFRSTRSTSAWSSRGGQTRNPFALNRNPSGSSSGSGAAVSANLCVVAIGTETNGSIISPASHYSDFSNAGYGRSYDENSQGCCFVFRRIGWGGFS